MTNKWKEKAEALIIQPLSTTEAGYKEIVKAAKRIGNAVYRRIENENGSHQASLFTDIENDAGDTPRPTDFAMFGIGISTSKASNNFVIKGLMNLHKIRCLGGEFPGEIPPIVARIKDKDNTQEARAQRLSCDFFRPFDPRRGGLSDKIYSPTISGIEHHGDEHTPTLDDFLSLGIDIEAIYFTARGAFQIRGEENIQRVAEAGGNIVNDTRGKPSNEVRESKETLAKYLSTKPTRDR